MSNIDKRALREAAEKALQAMQRLLMMPNDELFNEALLNVDGDVDAANAFNLLTEPETMLALLDELEGKEKQRAAANKVVVQQDIELQELRLRIAELEAREVREEGNQFLVVRHPGRSPVIKHSAGDLEGFLRQLLEHDPMATIDIITHRYYGVGGQWVQDADEYLQMMAAAAGKGE